MLICCLKQVKDFILKVPRKFKFLLGYTKLVLFLLTSDESDDDVLVRLSLIEQLIKDKFDEHFIQCKTSTDFLGIVNEFVQYDHKYFQYVYIPI